MGQHYGTTGMWYKDGLFYELLDTHVNFFLNNPEKLGFTQNEKSCALKTLCHQTAGNVLKKVGSVWIW